MNVFVTGGTGLIGSAVIPELLANGHTVLALARSDASALVAHAAGAQTLRGGLADLDTLRVGTADADGVVHLAFSNDFSSADAVAQAVAEETAALTTLGEALVGSGRPLVTVSGTPWVPGRLSTETDSLPTDGLVGGRGRTVTAVLGLASRGVRTSAVHALDAAVLMRLALERAPAGTAWHAVDDQGDAVRDIAAVIGRRLGLTVEALPEEHFGPRGAIFAMDQPSSSTYTQEELGWAPTRPSLLEDLENIQTESDRAGTMTRASA